MKLVVYDCETKNAIPSRHETPLDGIKYCAGWTDHAGMGVAVICAYVWGEGYRVFLDDNFDEWRALVERDDTVFAGFNNHSFDDKLVGAALGTHIPAARSYDLLEEVRVARGMARLGVGGVSQHELLRANFLEGKRGSGAFAPILWQKGKRGQVIDYCLQDVIGLKKLIELVYADRVRDPETQRILHINKPADTGIAVEENS